MFNNKPFATATAFGPGTFGNTTTTPFGQTNTFGAKPAAGNVFGGGSAFGATAPATGGLFGTTPTANTGLFGQTSTAFGQPAATSVFGGTSTTSNLFGTTTPATQSSGGLFGGSSTSAFGAPRPTFGGFGTTATSTNLFGQNTGASTSLFGGTSAGFGAATTGTTIKFNPPVATDTMLKSGQNQNISVRHQCITCMKEYENKSLEELRLEDYAANRKGPQAGVSAFGATTQQTGGLFGTPAASTGFSFGTTQGKPLFGTTPGTNTFGTTNSGLFGQTTQPQQGSSLFGKSVGFGTATTSTTPAFSFGTTNTSMFGQNNQQKPMFGQPTGTGLFGQTATSQPAAFGTQNTFGFGAPAQQQSTGLFGNKPTGFGSTATTTTNTFSFGNTANTGGLFGQKSATPAFGTGSTGFGTGFGTFGTTQAAGTNLFGQNKPAGTGFGTTTTGFGTTGFGTGFGNTGGFGTLGMNTSAGTSLFGQSLANKPTTFGFGNTGSSGFSFGQPSTGQTFNFGTNAMAPMTSNQNMANLMQQQLQTQQHLLALTNNPFGDNPLFRNPLKDSKKLEERLKPTNPAAQKAILQDSLYKVSPLPAAKVKPKPITPMASGKVSLFDGLEDEEPSLSGTMFMPKRSVKKLVIRQTASTTSSSAVVFTSSVMSSPNRPNEINMSTSIRIESTPTHLGNDSVVIERSPQSANAHCQGDALRQSSPLTVEISDRVLEANTFQHIDDTQRQGRHSMSPLHDSVGPQVAAENVVCDIPQRKNFNTSLNDTIEALHTKSGGSSPTERAFGAPQESADVSRVSEKDNFELSLVSQSEANQDGHVSSTYEKPHPTGIKLRREGYYTIPSLDELVPLIDGNGNCFVAEFVVGREGFGKVMFPGMINVSNLDLDEIVTFKKKEIIIYPDDDNKPPVGEGLNRTAEITLENVWPIDKTTHTPIKDPERLSLMGFIDKIERNTARLGARFIEYKPRTGTWKFQVDHFSKYGLEDSDDEGDNNQQTKVKMVNGTKKLPAANGQILPGATNVTNQVQQAKKLKPTASDDDDEMQDVDLMCTEENFFSPLQQLVTTKVDSERIHGMKASFFMDDMEDSWEANEAEMHEPIPHFASLNNSEQFVKPVPIRKPATNLSGNIYEKQMFSQFEEEPRMQMMSTRLLEQEPPAFAPLYTLGQDNRFVTFAAPSSPLTIPYFETPVPMRRPVNAVAQKVGLKPLKKSLIYDKQRLIADISYFMGRRFRVGWGPNGTLCHLGDVNGTTPGQKAAKEISIYSSFSMPSPVSLQGYRPFNIALSKVEVLSDHQVDDVVKESIVQSLEVQFESSKVCLEHGVPVAATKYGADILHAHAYLSEKQVDDYAGTSHFDSCFLKQCNDVWELCVALWGKIPGLEACHGASPYARQMARREALSNWLIKTTKEKVQNEINNSTFDSSERLSAIFSYLTGRQISEAVSLAQESHDHGLATLLAQSEGNTIVRQQIVKQLSSWEHSGAYKLINHQRLKIYCLLAGCMVWNMSTAIINCCENLDWRRSLALHLWFSCSPTASITDAVKEFEKSFSDVSMSYSLPPYPPYMSEDISEANDDGNFYDTCFHLLKLYCDRSHSLNGLFAPETSTAAYLDYRLSWFLHEALDAIGYSHLSQNQVYNLHMNFASELEAMGLWHWSVFVVMHLSDSNSRMKYIKDLLLRHLTLDDQSEEKESFLQKKLLVPEEWIYEAKAIKANSFGRLADEARFLLKAGCWSKSHDIVIKHIASEAIINENYEYLLSFLNELAPAERSSKILDWASGGQVFLNYIYVSQMVDKVIKGVVSAYDVEKLQPEIVSLCYKLSSLSCFTAKDRLCQSEMAKKTATLLQAVFTLHAARAGSLACNYQLAPHIKNLPMPEDYALQELRSLARNYLQAVASE